MFRDKNFLVVDDNDINRILLKTQLSELGAQVSEAADGIEAVENVRTRSFDLIFLDLRMPGISGFDVIRAIRRDGRATNGETPVIAVTAHALPQQRRQILEAGFCDCLIKPILENQLLRVLETWLHTKRHDSPCTPLPCTDTVELSLESIIEKTGGNRTVAGMLVAKMALELPEQLTNVAKALDKDDYHVAREITHKINGSASFCGLSGIRKAANELETALTALSPKDTLRTRFQAMGSEIHAFLSKASDFIAALGCSR